MQTELRYGRELKPLHLPDDLDVEVLRLNPLPPLENPGEAIRAAYENPIGTAPLGELARGKGSAVIVISDVTRPVPNEAILLPMLEILESSGIARERITILNATGLHRANVGDELLEMVGKTIFENYRIENHDARDDAAMTDIGEVAFGEGQSARVALNSHYLNADLKITTGLVEPHFMAGYSGGRKVLCPGVASAATILQFHAPPMIGNPNARAGNLENNPIDAMSRAVACQAGMDFICNVTLSEEREITGVFAGDMTLAHQAAIAHVDKQTKVLVRPAEIVVTTSAGYPLDTTLYQAVKGMVCALPALAAGGTMIITASLSEGLGGPEFARKCLSMGDAESFLKLLYASPVEIDQWQLQELCMALQQCRIIMVSDGLDDATLKQSLLDTAPSVEVALEELLQKYGRHARITIIPEGPYVTPIAA